MEAHFRAKYPKSPEDSDGVYKSVIRAKALDTLRGLLPAATTSNVGLFGTGQAFEALLLRMFAHPLEEVRGCAAADADRAAPGDPGVPRARRSAEPRRPLDRVLRRDAPRASTPPPRRSSPTRRAEPRDEVTLTDFDPDGEIKVVAAALYSVVGAARRSAARDRARAVGRRSRRAAARLRRRPRQPPPQARPRVRAHQLPLRRPRRLRRLPRSAAPSPADARLAAAQRRATATPSRRRSRRPARSTTGAR